MEDDLDLAVKTLAAKQTPQDTYWAYYQGKQPLVYTAKRLEQLFGELDSYVAENWCSVVADTTLDRIQLEAITVTGDETATAQLQALWKRLELDLEAMDLHQAALIAGEAYLLAWPGPAGDLEIYFHDGRLCHTFAEADNPKRTRFACKWWEDADGYRRMNLYYPDRIEYYRSSRSANDQGEIAGLSGASFAEYQPAEANPFGAVPVFRFTPDRAGISELASVIPLQNAINKLLSDMMVTAEYAAFPQRWIISSAEVQGKLRNAPSEIWEIPAGDGMGQGTTVGQFPPADLSSYLNGIDHLATTVGVISRTPRHYFYRQAGDPSGEALQAMEAPLIAKVRRRIARLASSWRQAAAFILATQGLAVAPEAIEITFADPNTNQPALDAQIRATDTATGIPLTTTLRRQGWTQEELDQMELDRLAEAGRQADLADAVMAEAERRFDAGQDQAIAQAVRYGLTA